MVSEPLFYNNLPFVRVKGFGGKMVPTPHDGVHCAMIGSGVRPIISNVSCGRLVRAPASLQRSCQIIYEGAVGFSQSTWIPEVTKAYWIGKYRKILECKIAFGLELPHVHEVLIHKHNPRRTVLRGLPTTIILFSFTNWGCFIFSSGNFIIPMQSIFLWSPFIS